MIAFNSAVLCSRTDSLRLDVILQERLAFYSAFLNSHRSGVLTALTWLMPHETAAPCHFIQNRIRNMHACVRARICVGMCVLVCVCVC